MRQAMRVLSIGVLSAVATAGLLSGVADGKGGEGDRRPAPAETRRMRSDRFHRLVFYAVLEGLYEDGASNGFVDAVLRDDPATRQPMHFVPGCPLCVPALDALRVYRARVPFDTKMPSDTFGPGIPAEIADGMSSPAMKTRIDAVFRLVERSVRRRLDLMRLTEAERREWERGMAARRKKGMSMLRSLQASGSAGAFFDSKVCGVCDGAAGACEGQ